MRVIESFELLNWYHLSNVAFICILLLFMNSRKKFVLQSVHFKL